MHQDQFQENPHPGYPKKLEGKNPKIEDTEIGYETSV